MTEKTLFNYYASHKLNGRHVDDVNLNEFCCELTIYCSEQLYYAIRQIFVQ